MRVEKGQKSQNVRDFGVVNITKEMLAHHKPPVKKKEMLASFGNKLVIVCY